MLIAGGVFAQSNLPACQGKDSSQWNNCIGGFTGKNGNKTSVEYRDGKFNGRGTIIFNGNTYVGEFKDNKYHGQATYTFANGDKYVGEYKDDKRNGQGTLIFANGNKYVGEFKDSKIDGQGIFTYATGDKYVGELKDGKRNGQGTFTLATGDKYVGEYKDDKRNGQGTSTFANGEKYIGEYKDDKRNGQGTNFWADGREGVGEWKDGRPHGLFIEYKADKSIERSGIYEDGKFITSQFIDPNSFINLSQKVIVSQVTSSGEKAEPNKGTIQPTQPSNLGKRIALVVGNANYKTRPLRNPRNDADDVSIALKASGFRVIDIRDGTIQQMRAGVRQFGDQLINNDVGLVYYSGHGVEVKGRNYFIPVNADIMREDEIADQGLDVSLILEKMNTAGKGVNILIVDACRDDPFGRSFRSTSRGLAQMDAPRGTIIAYATSPGKVASDGDGRNSPYTKNLVKAMQQPNKPIEQVFKEVRRAVQEETKNQQTPWENTSLSGDFYFKMQR